MYKRQSFHKDGAVEHWFKYERPKVFQDEKGRAVQLNFAVIDTIKWNDQMCIRDRCYRPRETVGMRWQPLLCPI